MVFGQGISLGVASLAVALIVQPISFAAAQSYPEQPVQLVIPYPPGGGTDILGRVIAQEFSELWGTEMVAENRGGAAGGIGAQYVAGSQPDGYTILLAPNSYTINEHIQDLPFDISESFTPVGMIAVSPNVLAANNSVAADNVSELIDYAKENPGELKYGSSGIGNVPHLAGELFNLSAGVAIVHVPYQGSGPAMTALLSNEVQLAFPPLNSIAGLVESGDAKILAVLGASRSPLVPDVPTVAESGMPDFAVDLWYSLLAPADTPDEIIQKLNADLRTVLESDAIQESLTQKGYVPTPTTPDELGEIIRSDVARWGELLEQVPLTNQQ